jgi:hypothetical protein
MTIAFVIMLIVVIIQNTTIKRKNKEHDELIKKKYEEYCGIGKQYRRVYKFIHIDIFDNGQLNQTAEQYQKDGYHLDHEKSTDNLLVFAKRVEVKED